MIDNHDDNRPVQGPYDRLFKSDRAGIVKIAAATVVGVGMMLPYIATLGRHFPIWCTPYMVMIVVVSSATAAGILLRADSVRRRFWAGERVGGLSRLLFCAGIWSVLLWFIAALLVGFPLAVWFGTAVTPLPQILN